MDEFSDIKVVIGDKTYNLHKAILQTIPFFQPYITGGFKTDKIVIEDGEEIGKFIEKLYDSIKNFRDDDELELMAYLGYYDEEKKLLQKILKNKYSYEDLDEYIRLTKIDVDEKVYEKVEDIAIMGMRKDSTKYPFLHYLVNAIALFKYGKFDKTVDYSDIVEYIYGIKGITDPETALSLHPLNSGVFKGKLMNFLKSNIARIRSINENRFAQKYPNLQRVLKEKSTFTTSWLNTIGEEELNNIITQALQEGMIDKKEDEKLRNIVKFTFLK